MSAETKEKLVIGMRAQALRISVRHHSCVVLWGCRWQVAHGLLLASTLAMLPKDLSCYPSWATHCCFASPSWDDFISRIVSSLICHVHKHCPWEQWNIFFITIISTGQTVHMWKGFHYTQCMSLYVMNRTWNLVELGVRQWVCAHWRTGVACFILLSCRDGFHSHCDWISGCGRWTD